jgi:toxin HigB-1
MIETFADQTTFDIFEGKHSKAARRIPTELHMKAKLKLEQLDTADVLDDLLSPPGNRLEKLKGSWAGFHSVRVNAQWRIVFQWHAPHALNVQIVDYH